MTNCCESSSPSPTRHSKRRCPLCNAECVGVSNRTIAHHIKHSWQWDGQGRQYYFCDSRGCDVVYFGNDDSVIAKAQLREVVGIKEVADDGLLCYCFGVSRWDALRDPAAKEFVIRETKLGHCSCETSNPSGRCCLKDFVRG